MSNDDNNNNIIPYDPKIDIALDSLQTMVSCFRELSEEYRQELDNPDREYYIDSKIITSMELQKAVNKSVLDLFESILAPTYSRAEHY